MGIRETADPFELFGTWYGEVQESDIKEPTAVCLATADADGAPAARMVLLKDWSRDGFVFYTNLESDKGRALRANPKAALLFYWMPFGRQVRVQGDVEQVTDEEADAYFASRARQSRIGAWASKQSRPMSDRYELERRGGALWPEIRHRRGTPAAALVGLSGRAAAHRVLAGRKIPPASASCLYPRWRGVDDAVAFPVNSRRTRCGRGYARGVRRSNMRVHTLYVVDWGAPEGSGPSRHEP